jgi:transposase
MERVIERGCGLDVHKKTVVACVRVPGRTGAREQHVRTFGTTTAELLALRDWLTGYGVTHVAMESTGVYWKPIFYVLEDGFACVLANAAQIAQVPGRKTDVKDCVWIAQLLEHGLVRGSFVPPAAIRELRDLTRYRAALIGEHTRETNRLQKVLEDAGIKLASVASNVLGVSGRAMLEARPRAPSTPTSWPTWRAGRCAGSSRRCARPWPGASVPITPFWSVKCSPTSTTSTRSSRP